MDFVATIVMAALVLKLMSLLKYITNKQWKDAFTLLGAWTIGVVVAFLFKLSSFAAQIPVGDTTLADLKGGADIIIFGVSIAAVGGVVYDHKKALDNTDSAAEPSLLPE